MKIISLEKLLVEIRLHRGAKRKVYTKPCQGDWRQSYCGCKDQAAEFEYNSDTNTMYIGVII